MKPPGPRFIVRSTTARDAVLTVSITVLVLGFLGYGIFHMAQPVQGNKLTGTVVEKQFTPLKEKRIDFSRSKLTGARESEGEYLLRVRVDSEQGRVFDVPVARFLYETKKTGDLLTFIRPPSEQR